MSLQIYVNFLADGGYHLGVSKGTSTRYVRTTQGPGQLLLAYIEVTLSESAPQTFSSLDSVVDDAMKQIGTPVDQQNYEKTTPYGAFGFSTRPGYPKTAEEIKQWIRRAFEWVKEVGIQK